MPIGKSFGVMIGGSTGCSRKICFSEYQNLRLKNEKGPEGDGLGFTRGRKSRHSIQIFLTNLLRIGGRAL